MGSTQYAIPGRKEVTHFDTTNGSVPSTDTLLLSSGSLASPKSFEQRRHCAPSSSLFAPKGARLRVPRAELGLVPPTFWESTGDIGDGIQLVLNGVVNDNVIGLV